MTANRLEQRHERSREHPTEQATDQRQRHTLGQHLAEQSRPSGSERRAHGVLLLPSQASRQQEARHVGRRDQKDERHGSEQRQKQPTSLDVEDVHERLRSGGQALEVRIGARQPRGNRRHIRAGLRRARSRLKATDDVPAALLGIALVRYDRQPEIDWGIDVVVGLTGVARIGQEPHARRHDANHLKRRRHTADPDGPADDAWVFVEPSLPQVVADDHRGRQRVRSRRFGVEEIAPEHGPEAKQLEVVPADRHPAQRFTSVRQNQEIECPAVQRWWLDRAARRAPRHPLPIRWLRLIGLAVESRGGDEHEPVWLDVGRR